jgi:hypothetical protein
MKKALSALAAAALVVVAPALLARNASAKTSLIEHKKHHAHVAQPHHMQAGRSNQSYPAAFGYAPGAATDMDKDVERSRQAGGGGGGGGGM